MHKNMSCPPLFEDRFPWECLTLNSKLPLDVQLTNNSSIVKRF